jgi:hypothetical protein
VVGLAAIAPESGPLVDPPCGEQYVIGPQRDSPVAGSAGESQTLVHQPGPDSRSARRGLDEQQAQLCGVLRVSGGAEHAADPLPVQLGDPRRLALGGGAFSEVGHDARDQRLERRVPAVLGRVSVTVPLDHPAEVARPRRAQDEAAPPRFVTQRAANPPHRGDEFGSLTVVERRQHGCDRACLQLV